MRITPACLAATLALSACGGGGSGGGSQSAPPPEPPPDPVTFTVSGTVTASPNQSVDGDTNDLRKRLVPNDSFASAQEINNPTTLGGYVNQPGTGESGRSQVEGDVDDYFRVQLLADQAVTLLVAEFEQADADLYLYDAAGRIVDFSTETGQLETLTAPADGSYVVNVNAFEGATNYVLAIGSQAGASGFSRQHYIEPWQSVVEYSAEQGAPGAIEAELNLEKRGGGPGRPRLVSIRRSVGHDPFFARRLGNARDKWSDFADPSLRARFETLLTIKTLARRPGIKLAEPNYRMNAFATPDDGAFPFQWHYPLIELPAAWDTSTGDPSVIVAVVDTGILAGHPDLVGQLTAGYDFVRNPASAADGDGIDPDPADEGNFALPGGGTFHGSHVAGTVAAAGDNGLGVTGVAYGARIMPLRALGIDGSGTSYDVSQAVRYAAGLPNDSNSLPARPADVINLSLGGGPFSQADQRLFDELRERGIVVVAAAGNEATSAPQYPAGYRNVLSVSAVDIDRQVTAYSNRGASIDVAAPGGNNGTDRNGDGYPDGVLSTGATNDAGLDYVYTFSSGTSMAAPHVAGVVALMLSVNPELQPGDIDSLLVAGRLTDDLGLAGRDDAYGYGLVNAAKAVAAALESRGSDPLDSPRLAISAGTLSFGSRLDSLELDIGNAGRGELRLDEITVSRPWLRIDPIETDSNGLGLYRVSVDRAGLADGVYSAEIQVFSNANAAAVTIYMAVGSSGGEADVGPVYILLYDRELDETVAQAVATSDAGDYRFSLRGVPAGQYQLVAGSDADNDLVICDPGEACGAWLTLDQPLTLDLQGDRQGIEFPIEYRIFLPANPAASGTDPAAPERPAIKGYPLR